MRRSRRLLLAAGLAAGCLAIVPRPGAQGGQGSEARPFGPARELSSRRGMAVSAAPEASRAGAEILEAGGNAVDAAIAVSMALAVVYPQAGNLAGGGFLVARSADGHLDALDFRETAPAGTWERSFLGKDGRPVPDASLLSGLAVATPGSVRGLAEAHRRLGSLSWARILAPAIRLAREGFRVPGRLTRDVQLNREALGRSDLGRSLFLPGGRPVAEGTLLVQPELAATLEAIARGGADAFHRGPIAKRIAEFVREKGGVLTVRDLEGYEPVWRAPVEVTFDGWTLVTMPLPSSGGFVLQSVLGQLDAAPGSWRGRMAAEAIHVVAEAERRAYADRNSLLGDADCVPVPLARLLAPSRLAALGAGIDPYRATPSRLVTAGGSTRAEREETTHLSVAAADGAAVSLTTTLNGAFGTGLVVPGAGVLLNNEMDDFTTAPGVPNLYDLVQGESNAVRAGARPLSSMTPTLVLRDGRMRLVTGSPGGSTIPTTVLQVFLNACPRGLPLGDAVAAPRFHSQHVPDVLFVEKGAVPPGLAAELRARGHVLKERPAIGLVHAIAFERDGRLTGAADPRGYGEPAAPRP